MLQISRAVLTSEFPRRGIKMLILILIFSGTIHYVTLQYLLTEMGF